MKLVALLFLFIILIISGWLDDSPHGSDFQISCNTCHSAKGWEIDKEIYSFDHGTTRLPLTGQHIQADCRNCHPTLVFSEAKTECVSCHTDPHQSTVGSDCSRCHTPESWLVKNITEIHQMSRFPLLGAHRTADCFDCHKSENLIRFDIPDIECISCHRRDYLATTNPNHFESGISDNCILCHSINSNQWAGPGFDHSYFPLVNAHSEPLCAECHKTSRYSDTQPECNSCHQKEFIATANPNHTASGFSNNCEECHSLNPGWKPANIDHTKFPLTLGHADPACIDCHKNGNFSVISGDCYSCHQPDYASTTDPNHQSSGFSITCTDCHTTNPDWKPTTFNHNSFPLTLGHSGPSCYDCHKGNYTSTSNDCYACHATDYNVAVNPNHRTLSFSTSCSQCHTTNPDWKPASYLQHDTQFPIYSGNHRGEWNTCTDCHINLSNYSTFSCINCHEHNKTDMDNEHNGESGYSYASDACYNCHPRGDS